MSSSSQDESLSRVDYQLLGSPRRSEQEHRSCRRRPFFAIQSVAPYDGSRVPDQSEFFCVESRDLTSRGVSLFLRGRPNSDFFVMAFDTPPTVSYAVAEVVHCTDVVVYPSGLIEPVGEPDAGAASEAPENEAGERMVLVGCRFTQRLQGSAG